MQVTLGNAASEQTIAGSKSQSRCSCATAAERAALRQDQPPQHFTTYLCQHAQERNPWQQARPCLVLVWTQQQPVPPGLAAAGKAGPAVCERTDALTHQSPPQSSLPSALLQQKQSVTQVCATALSSDLFRSRMGKADVSYFQLNFAELQAPTSHSRQGRGQAYLCSNRLTAAAARDTAVTEERGGRRTVCIQYPKTRWHTSILPLLAGLFSSSCLHQTLLEYSLGLLLMPSAKGATTMFRIN